MGIATGRQRMAAQLQIELILLIFLEFQREMAQHYAEAADFTAFRKADLYPGSVASFRPVWTRAGPPFENIATSFSIHADTGLTQHIAQHRPFVYARLMVAGYRIDRRDLLQSGERIHERGHVIARLATISPVMTIISGTSGLYLRDQLFIIRAEAL